MTDQEIPVESPEMEAKQPDSVTEAITVPAESPEIETELSAKDGQKSDETQPVQSPNNKETEENSETLEPEEVSDAVVKAEYLEDPEDPAPGVPEPQAPAPETSESLETSEPTEAMEPVQPTASDPEPPVQPSHSTDPTPENDAIKDFISAQPTEVQHFSDDDIEVDISSASESEAESESEDSDSGSDAESEPADEEEETINGPISSKNEVLDETAPTLPEDYEIPENAPLEYIGEVTGLVEKSVVIKAEISGEFRVLKDGSVLCFEDRTLLGPLFETFGKLQSPVYRVKFNTDETFEKFKDSKGKKVYYVVPESQFLYTDTIKSLKGTDASNCHDEELPEEEQEYSDDEREAAAKLEKKRKKKGNKKKEPSKKPHPAPANFTPYGYAPKAQTYPQYQPVYQPQQVPHVPHVPQVQQYQQYQPQHQVQNQVQNQAQQPLPSVYGVPYNQAQPYNAYAQPYPMNQMNQMNMNQNPPMNMNQNPQMPYGQYPYYQMPQNPALQQLQQLMNQAQNQQSPQNPNQQNNPYNHQPYNP